MFLDYISLASELFFPTIVSCCNPPAHVTGRRELSLGICVIAGRQADEPWAEFPGYWKWQLFCLGAFPPQGKVVLVGDTPEVVVLGPGYVGGTKEGQLVQSS